MNEPSSIGRIGFRAGLAACAATLAYDVVQILQVLGLLRFPLDEVLIYGTSLCIVVPFVLEILAFHHTRLAARRFWSHGALIFASIYAVFGSANYVVQLATVVPAKLRGAEGTIAVLEQTPHSLFWDFDAAAYIAMGIATLMVIPALEDSVLERRVRLVCKLHVAATALSGVVYFYPTYSSRLLLVGFPWAVTAPLFMLFLGIALKTAPTGVR